MFTFYVISRFKMEKLFFSRKHRMKNMKKAKGCFRLEVLHISNHYVDTFFFHFVSRLMLSISDMIF